MKSGKSATCHKLRRLNLCKNKLCKEEAVNIEQHETVHCKTWDQFGIFLIDSAVAAANLCGHSANITVVNTRTLCGPHRHMVEKANALAQEGKTKEEILNALDEIMSTHKSFLLPADFDYLRRGGRLSPLVSYVGKAANLTPVMTQTDDGCRLTIAAVRRGFAHGFKYVAEAMVKHGVGAGWKVYVVHADAMVSAQKALDTMKQYIPDAQYEVHPLSPAFITQGGPGCVAIQAVKI